MGFFKRFKGKAAKYANYLRALSDEAERYHIITKEIEKLEHELDKVSKIKDRAFGLEKVNAMNKELAKLKELQKTQKEYMSQVKMALQYDKENLAKYGISVDKNGLVENYESIATSTADYSAYNNALKEWNSQTSEEGQKALDEKWAGVYNEATGEFYDGYLDWAETLKEDAEKSHEEKMKALQQYEDTWSLYQEVEAALQDRENQIYDAMLEKTSYVVDINLDIQDRDMQLLEFLLGQIEDASYNAAKSIAMIGLQTENAFKQINIAKSGIQGILENHGFSAGKAQAIIENGDFASLSGTVSFTEEEMSTMSGWIDDIFAKNSELLEMREAAWQNVRDEFNQYLEDMDKGIAKIDRLNDVTKNYQNIIDILGTGVLNVSNALIEDLNKTVVLNTQNALKASQAELGALKKSREEVMSIDTTGWSEDALRQHQQTIDEMEEAILTAEDNVAQRWQDALQAATDAWKTAVTNIVDEFEDKVAGALGSLSELQESFDRASEIDSRYVEQYEKIYELSKLTRQINQDIDASNNLHVKQELRDLAQEIAEIEASGVEMSKYDLENLQRRYELKKAELALEEANGAKSTVNMVRGGDGSYSYVYTANEEDVAAAEQTYEDKLFAMQQANAEYINSLQGQIIQVQQEYADAIRALQEDTTLSQEEYEKKAAEFAEYYGGKLAYFSDELGKALNNNQQLYTEDWQSYSERTGYKITSNDEYITNFEETNLAIVGGYESLSEVENNFKEASSQMLSDLSIEYQMWQTEIDTVMQLAGTSVQGFSDDVYNAINDDNGIKNQSNEAATAVEEMGQRMESAFESISLSIETWEQNWGAQIDLAIEKNNQLMQSYNEMMSLMASGVDGTSSSNLNVLNSEQPTVEEKAPEPEVQTPSPNPSQTKPQAGNKSVDNADKAEGVAAAIWMLGGPASGWGNDPERAKKLKEKGVTGAQSYINQHARNGDIYASWWDRYDELQQYRYGAFDTGGYTGDWGDNSGRLALLHSKEIVLNAEDTKNFLSAIELVREIANIIDLNAAAASGAYSTMSSVGSGLGGGGGMTQHVEIHASFPDAVDHSQIEQAFTNLINTASQYANRDR